MKCTIDSHYFYDALFCDDTHPILIDLIHGFCVIKNWGRASWLREKSQKSTFHKWTGALQFINHHAHNCSYMIYLEQTYLYKVFAMQTTKSFSQHSTVSPCRWYAFLGHPTFWRCNTLFRNKNLTNNEPLNIMALWWKATKVVRWFLFDVMSVSSSAL